MPVRFTDQNVASLLAAILGRSLLPDLGSGPRTSSSFFVQDSSEPVVPQRTGVNPYSPVGREQRAEAQQRLAIDKQNAAVNLENQQLARHRFNASLQSKAFNPNAITPTEYRSARTAAMKDLYGADHADAADTLRTTLMDPALSVDERRAAIDAARASGWNVDVGESTMVPDTSNYGIMRQFGDWATGNDSRPVIQGPPTSISVKPSEDAIRSRIQEQMQQYREAAGIDPNVTSQQYAQPSPLTAYSQPVGPQPSPVARQISSVASQWQQAVADSQQSGMEFSEKQKTDLQKLEDEASNIQSADTTSPWQKEEALLGIAQKKARIVPQQRKVTTQQALDEVSVDHPSGTKFVKRQDGSFEAVMPPGKDARNDSKRLSFDTSMAAIQEWKALQDGGILPDAAKRVVEAMFNIRLPDEMREKFKSPSNVRQEHDMNMGVLDRQSNHNQQQQQQLEQQAAREQQLQAQQQAAEYRRAAGFEDTLTTGSTGEQHASPYPQQQQVPQQDMPQAEPPVKLDDGTDPFAPKKSAIPEFENLRPTGDSRLDGMLEQNKQIVEKLLPDDRVAIMNVIEINNALKNGEPSAAEMAQMYEKLGNVKAKLEQSINNGTLSHADAQAAYSALQAIQAHQSLVKQRK